MVTVELTQLHDIYNITLTIETSTDQILGLNEKSETGFVLRYLLGYFFSSCLDISSYETVYRQKENYYRGKN